MSLILFNQWLKNQDCVDRISSLPAPVYLLAHLKVKFTYFFLQKLANHGYLTRYARKLEESRAGIDLLYTP